jgi:probable HAF family extracellular repeat protein
VTDLGRFVDVVGINDSGDVAVNVPMPGDPGKPGDLDSKLSSLSGGRLHRVPDHQAFLYSHGQLHNLGALGGPASTARDINESGDVVGESRVDLPGPNGRSVSHAFLYAAGSMTDPWASVGIDDGRSSAATAINAAGEIAGQIGQRACVLSHGKVLFLGSLSPGGYVVPKRINRLGEVVGGAKSSDGSEHGFLFSREGLMDLGTLGGSFSQAHDINDSGQIAGSSQVAGGNRHAFLYERGSMLDLGVPTGFEDSDARAINSSGQIVGSGSTVTGVSKDPLRPVFVESHAFLYTSGKWVDLNDLVDLSESGLRSLSQAEAINGSGQIAGSATAADGYHAFLLTPIGRNPHPG